MSGAITPVTMPKFGLAMTEGKLADWLIQVGETVSAGQELADIETSKITNGYESPVSGVLRRQVVAAGETLPVGALLGVVADASVADDAIDAFIAEFQANNASADTEASAADAEPSVVAVDGLDIRVKDVGAAEGSQLPVLLIHGFGGDLTSWMLNQSALSHDRRVIAFDLPGHGESSKSVGEGKPSSFAGTVAKLLETLDADKVHVIGHSLGGAISLELARLAPEKVASLSLIAPAGLGPDVNMTFINGFISEDRRKTLEPILQLLVHDKSLISRRMIENIIRFKRLDGATGALRTIADACFPDGKQADNLRATLENYPGPVQVIWGENDEILSSAPARSLPDKVAVSVLSETGHMPQMEKVSDVNKAISAFLEKND